MKLIDKIKTSVRSWLNITVDTDTIPKGVNRSRRNTQRKDLTFDYTVDPVLTKALYYNRWELTKLGAHFARNIINIPLAFMGFPHFYTTKKVQKFWQDTFDFYNEKMIKTKQDIQRTSSRDGTTWIFPRFDVDADRVVWDFLGQVNRFFYNVDTKKLTGIEFEEQICIVDEIGNNKTIIEKTTYTKAAILIDLDGVRTIRRNTTGALPINFVNNGEPEEPEGSSDLEVVYPRILLYSQIAVKKNEILLNHEPKLIQNVTDVEAWKRNNGITDLTEVDISTLDFIINMYDKESTEFIVPEDIIAGYEIAQKTNFRNMVEGSEIPEIVWGLKTEGNHASAEEQIAVFISFVNMKRNGLKGSYDTLINITFQLMAESNFKQFNFEIEQTWNDLDMLTEVEKSELFDNYASGIGKLRKAGVLGKKGTYKILQGVLGEDGIEEIEKYLDDIEAEVKEKETPTEGDNTPDGEEDEGGEE